MSVGNLLRQVRIRKQEIVIEVLGIGSELLMDTEDHFVVKN